MFYAFEKQAAGSGYIEGRGWCSEMNDSSVCMYIAWIASNGGERDGEERKR